MTSLSIPLVTQLIPPRLPFGFVERPRLLDMLDRGSREAITLVCGPLGSGKTSILTSWAQSDRAPKLAWVSLSAGDDDPLRFWSVVLAAFREADPGSPVVALAPPRDSTASEFLPLLINALAAAPSRQVLVLEDVHLLRARQCVRQLDVLLLHVPATLHVVLSTRTDLRLPLQSARLRGRLTEIRAADLAFTESEAAELLVAHGIELDARQISQLRARTEGWAAGLRLAALNLRDSGDPERFVADFAGDDRGVADYLIKELVDRQPPHRRRFLLRTAIVDRLCGELADALTDESTGHDTLAELERTNGFVLGLDSRGHWYRYHILFAELLRARADRELGDEVRGLHTRAARWLALHGETSDALRHAAAAEDWETAGHLLATRWLDLLMECGPQRLHALMLRLPTRSCRPPWDASCSNWATSPRQSRISSASRATGAGGWRSSSPWPGCSERARLAADPAAAREAAQRLLEAGLTIGGADRARHALIELQLGSAALWAGALSSAAHRLTRSIELAQAGDDYVATTALGLLALLELWRSGPKAAEPLARMAVELAAQRDWDSAAHVAAAHIALAACAACTLRPADAELRLRQADKAAAGNHDPAIKLVLAGLAAAVLATKPEPRTLAEVSARPRLDALRRRLLDAAGSLPSAGASVAREPAGRDAGATAAAARRCLAAGDAETAVELIEAISPDAVAIAFSGTRVELAVLAAIAHDMLSAAGAADAALEQALDIADATGHRTVFLAGGRRMGELLRRRIRAGTQHRAIVDALLAFLETGAPGRKPYAALTMPLSERELTVLRYLPTVLVTREIASELFVSTNTVKTHLRSIYRKLDAQNRREAVAHARDLRLLSSRAVH